MRTVDHLEVLRAERRRIVSVLDDADMDAPVPACPDWRLADLAWHLVDGMRFWQRSIRDGSADPGDVTDEPRPPVGELAANFERESAALVELLASRPADAPCWSWHPDGGTIGWLRRRQAHELRIHRLDVEQAADVEPTETDPAVAADGIDEMLTVFLTGTPPWASFVPDEATVRFAATDRDRAWTARFGRCLGAPPGGDPVELDCLELIEPAAPDLRTAPDVTVTATAAQLDSWLWRRVDHVAHDGDPALYRRLVELLRDVTG